MTEGPKGNLPYDAGVEAAILRAMEDRSLERLAFQMDANRHLMIVEGLPERLMTDIEPPKPVKVALLWAHLKIAVAGVLTHEAAEHEQSAEKLLDAGDAPRATAQRGTAAAKRRIAQHLQQDAELEIAHLQAQAARRNAARGGEGLGVSDPAEPDQQVPGFDV